MKLNRVRPSRRQSTPTPGPSPENAANGRTDSPSANRPPPGDAAKPVRARMEVEPEVAQQRPPWVWRAEAEAALRETEALAREIEALAREIEAAAERAIALVREGNIEAADDAINEASFGYGNAYKRAFRLMRRARSYRIYNDADKAEREANAGAAEDAYERAEIALREASSLVLEAESAERERVRLINSDAA